MYQSAKSFTVEDSIIDIFIAIQHLHIIRNAMLVDSVYISNKLQNIDLQRRPRVATRKLTDKQKDKLKDSKFVRSNSVDVTVNSSFEEDIEYDSENGTLTFDKRTKEGKEIERILNSRNRKPSSPVDEELEEDDEEVWDDDEIIDDEDYEDDDVPWEFRSPENYYNYIYGPNHDEDDESVADLYED